MSDGRNHDACGHCGYHGPSKVSRLCGGCLEWFIAAEDKGCGRCGSFGGTVVDSRLLCGWCEQQSKEAQMEAYACWRCGCHCPPNANFCYRCAWPGLPGTHGRRHPSKVGLFTQVFHFVPALFTAVVAGPMLFLLAVGGGFWVCESFGLDLLRIMFDHVADHVAKRVVLGTFGVVVVFSVALALLERGDRDGVARADRRWEPRIRRGKNLLFVVFFGTVVASCVRGCF